MLLYVLWLPFSVALSFPSSLKDIPNRWSSSLLYCGRECLQFTLPTNKTEIIPFLTVLDSEGQSHYFNKSACISISWEQEGMLVLTAPYIGCFIVKKNGNFLMTLRIERQEAVGEVVFYEEHLLKCPIHLPALDSPGSSVCLGIQKQDRLPCAAQPVSEEECVERGCCYSPDDPHVPCYYGNTVTAHCTPDGRFSIAVSRDVTLPSLILDSVYLVNGRDRACSPVTKNNAFVLYNFPLSACGTTFQGAEDSGIYVNELMARQDIQNWNTGLFTQDSTFRLYVSCRYSTGNFLPLSVQIFTLPPPPIVSQYGPLNLELRIATDQHYSEYYANGDYPVVKLLKEPVFLEVRLLPPTDTNLILVLYECWATPSANPLQQPQWPILVNRCPHGGDNYQTQFILIEAAEQLQFPLHYQRFVIDTFTFADSATQEALTGPVYFHCSASTCVPSVLDSCMANCPGIRAKRTSKMQVPKDNPRCLVTAQGPVDFQMSKALLGTQEKGSFWASPILSKEWERALVVAVGTLLVILAFVGVRRYCGRSNHNPTNI